MNVFATLQRYRLAARRIARSPELGNRRSVALVRLVELIRNRHGGDPWLATALQQIVYAEGFEYLVYGKTPAAARSSWTADPVINACRRLLAAGRANCDHCLRPLPDRDTLARWEDLDRALWHEALAREGALQLSFPVWERAA
jgi:hypothetical protein